MKNIKTRLLLLAMPFLLAGCGTSRNASIDARSSATTPAATSPNTDYVSRVAANRLSADCLTASLSNISWGGKPIPLVGGELRMKRGDVVQLIVSAPFVGEVGRIEFSADNALLINRIDREYVQIPYSQISFLQATSLDFNALQALFWDELFVPSAKDVSKTADKFTLSESGSHTLLSLKGAPQVDYFFLTQTQNAVIDRISASEKKATNPIEVECAYANFKQFKGRPMPGRITLQTKGLSKNYSLSFELGGYTTKANWTPHATIPAKYTRRTADQMLGKLGSFTNK